MNEYDFTTATIQSVFAEEVQRRAGHVTETFDDGSRLFTRSLLPYVQDVRPKDRLQGGLALRATESEVWVHPYVFRQVCSNGAIMAHTLESHHLEFSEDDPQDEVLSELRDAIGACCTEEVFTANVNAIRRSTEIEVDLALSVLSMLAGHPGPATRNLLFQIFERFSSERDRSHFGLMNAVTSVARDTTNPERRWRLEELGGGIGAMILPTGPVDWDRSKNNLDEAIEIEDWELLQA